MQVYVALVNDADLQTKRKNEDTKMVIRIRKSKNRQQNGQKTEGQTIEWPKEKGEKDKQQGNQKRKSKDRQYNCQMKKGQKDKQ